MFCSNCGAKIQDGTQFCPQCGNKIDKTAPSIKEVKVILDPNEATSQKQVTDSSKSFSGQGKTFGLILMILSIIGDLAAMCVIGFDAFIPVTIGASVLFIIGLLLRLFCP